MQPCLSLCLQVLKTAASGAAGNSALWGLLAKFYT